MNKMEVFTKKVGGKYCPHFKFGNQTFRLNGFDTKEESEHMESQLKACFSNYGRQIHKNINKNLMSEALKSLKNILKVV